MPLYEYKCQRCGKTFEIIQKFSDQPLTVHEQCGGEVERLISAPSFQFKGTGWYVTVYARGKDAGKSSGNGSTDPKTSAKTETKSESKSETKSETKSESKTESKPAPSKS